MPSTLNISLTDDQKGWLNSRREAGGYASASDVVRDLIRSEQEAERRQLAQQFRGLQRDGSNEPEPAAAVMASVRRIKKERRAT